MDWDDVQKPVAKGITTGEPLDRLSISELEERIAALLSEAERHKAEIERKVRQAQAADAIFKS